MMNKPVLPLAKLALIGLLALAAQACKPANDSQTTALVSETKQKSKPNIVLVITDDQGYGDVGVYQNPLLQTPQMDLLHAQSVRLTNFHVSPTCSPTRAALFSGQNSLKAGIWHTVMARSILDAKHYTLAEALRDNGYKTGLFGKWHLGDNYPNRPEDQGFDEVLMHGGGGVGQTPDYWGNTQFGDTYLRNGKPEKFSEYATKVWFDEGIKFIKENKQQPFFAYISTNAPHSPFRAPQAYVEPYLKEGLSENGARYFGMIAYVDEQIGRLRAEIRDAGIEDNTIFIFATDNGSTMSDSRLFGKANMPTYRQRLKDDPNWQSWNYNAGMRGYKTSMYEGGHRVPFFISYPNGNLGQPRDIDSLTAHFDLYPTLLEFAGIDVDKIKQKQELDGVSLKGLIEGQQDNIADRTIMVTNQRVDQPNIDRPMVLMTQRWRYITNAKGSARNPKLKEQLFEIANDPHQDHDVSDEYPEVVADFRQQLKQVWLDNSTRFGTRQLIVVGSDDENPARLNGMDWIEAPNTFDVPVYPGFKPLHHEIQKNAWLNKESQFKPLPWSLMAEQTAQYQISGYLWDKPAGKPVERKYVFVEIDGKVYQNIVHNNANGGELTLPLKQGPFKMKVWFADDEQGVENRLAAIYVYVKRL
ncbi:arylsulfatase [Thalassotalea fonticola]|uniref:Arylsulfatase n=1 Tax=Thalassotalea fonticola TaxID=3065649 RepID=A0ABZ0GQC1_9GAMM|nr:arylsulfatase [Colwelliaceae bacterium S1-1]